MNIQICTNQEAWNNGLLAQKSSEFLQSWEWGEFQRAMGREVWRLQIGDDQAQVITHQLPFRFRYAYIPRLRTSDFGLQALLECLHEQGLIFVRIELAVELSESLSLKSEVRKLKSVKNRQPKDTLVIDLKKSEAELLIAMHQKTRYNIHLAQKKGVRVENKKNISIFWQLHAQTAQRDKFRGHSRVYYERMLASPISRQLTAYIGGQPIASLILICFGDTCTYLHGASADEGRNNMATYLLQWESMRFARQSGYSHYDLWGVAPSDAMAHPWAGITRFKAGFGGTLKSYPPAVDIIFSSWKYSLYQAARRLFGMV